MSTGNIIALLITLGIPLLVVLWAAWQVNKECKEVEKKVENRLKNLL
jgi:cell division protein FtsL